jgi:Spy/CpxP family protein refolding chaperone
MKRIARTALLALLVAAAGTVYAQGPGGRGMGPGVMEDGMEYGMMRGGGKGRGGMDMNPALAQLPAEKREQVRAVQVAMMQAVASKRAEMQSKSLALREAMRAFPLDQAAIKKLREGIDQVRAEMFALHLDALAQTQQIVGKDAWEQMHSGPPQGGRRTPPPGRERR